MPVNGQNAFGDDDRIFFLTSPICTGLKEKEQFLIDPPFSESVRGKFPPIVLDAVMTTLGIEGSERVYAYGPSAIVVEINPRYRWTGLRHLIIEAALFKVPQKPIPQKTKKEKEAQEK